MIHTLPLLRKISSCCLVSLGNCFKNSKKRSLFLLGTAQWRLLWQELPFGWASNAERAASIHVLSMFRGFWVLEFAPFSEFQMLICETEATVNDRGHQSQWVVTNKQWERRIQTAQSTGVVTCAGFMHSYTSFMHYAEATQSSFTGHYQVIICSSLHSSRSKVKCRAIMNSPTQESDL